MFGVKSECVQIVGFVDLKFGFVRFGARKACAFVARAKVVESCRSSTGFGAVPSDSIEKHWEVNEVAVLLPVRSVAFAAKQGKIRGEMDLCGFGCTFWVRLAADLDQHVWKFIR